MDAEPGTHDSSSSPPTDADAPGAVTDTKGVLPGTDPVNADPEPEVAAPRARRGGWGRWIVEWVAVLVLAVGVAVTVRTFVVQTFFIPSASMEPTLMVGDRIVVDKLSYDLHAVHRGDIVVFRRPPLEPDTSVQDLVKRVVGLPGETISSAPDGTVLIDGRPLAQRWLPAEGRSDPGPPIRPQTIPRGYYFVMGDNRGDSSDSRVFGPISGSLIVGHAQWRIWPLSRLGGL